MRRPIIALVMCTALAGCAQRSVQFLPAGTDAPHDFVRVSNCRHDAKYVPFSRIYFGVPVKLITVRTWMFWEKPYMYAYAGSPAHAAPADVGLGIGSDRPDKDKTVLNIEGGYAACADMRHTLVDGGWSAPAPNEKVGG